MNDSQFLSLAWTQLIQVSVLIAVVWLLVKLFARQRPHLAHALWLLVLVKCLTPPIMSSPTGLLSQIPVPEVPWAGFLLQEEQQTRFAVDELEPEPDITQPPEPWEPKPEIPEPQRVVVDDLSKGFVVEESELPPDIFREEPEVEWADIQPVETTTDSEPTPTDHVITSSTLWKSWLALAGAIMLLTVVRVLITLRRVYRHRVTVPAELESIVARLSKQLGLRRKVRILVTASKVGPAVVGFFRPLLILPQVVTQGRSPQELEPIIAHELLHVKRGDLDIGWLQVLVQSLWWFHPLVWLVNRFLNREAERCCDEAVVAELDCPPAVYARCLLNVLEQKRNLTPIPACPGVKPVDLTKQRMERIMKLGQGCCKRTPWWCWLIVVLLGLIVLPGQGESDTEGNQSTVIFKLNDAESTKVTTEIEKEGVEASATDTSKLVTQTYSIENIVQRMCDDHDLTEQDAQIHLELLISNSISSLHVGPLFQDSPAALTKCIVSENSLIVRGTDDGHELVKGLLKLWEDVGLYQVKIETRFASTDVQISAENVTGKQDATSALTAKLTDLDAFRLINTMQSDARTNIFFAPKLTLFNGQQAVVQDEVIRPFVTGIDGNKPVIETLPEGWKLKITPTVDAKGNIELDYQLRLATILDVETKDLPGRQSTKPTTIQIPDARQMHVRSKTTLQAGETLLISGLKRHTQKQDENHAENLLVMITPKLEKAELHNLAGKAMKSDVPQPFVGGSGPGVPQPWEWKQFSNRVPMIDEVDKSGTSTVDPELWKILVQWERACQGLQRLECNQKRFVYDSVFRIEKRSEGKLFLEAPDKWRIDIEPVPVEPGTKSRKLSSIGEPYSLKSETPELWIRNGRKVAQTVEHREKTYMIHNIPEQSKPNSFFDLRALRRLYTLGPVGPLGAFWFGLSAKEAVDRFQFTLLPETDEQRVWLNILPKQAEDKGNWQQAELILDRITLMPLAIKLVNPAGTTETVYSFSDFKINGKVDKDLFNISQVLKEYQLIEPGKSAREAKSLSPKDGPGPSVMPSLTPSPRKSDTVQLRFLGPEKSFLSIRVPDRSNTTYDLLLPGRLDLAPGKKYLLTLENIPGKSIKSDWPVPFTHDPRFHWSLEILPWSERTKRDLGRNPIPLTMTDEDLDQVAANNDVTKVVYVRTKRGESGLSISIETLASTRLDPGVDPIIAARRRGTILAVLRSERSLSASQNDAISLEEALQFHAELMNCKLVLGEAVLKQAGVHRHAPVDHLRIDYNNPRKSLALIMKRFGLTYVTHRVSAKGETPVREELRVRAQTGDTASQTGSHPGPLAPDESKPDQPTQTDLLVTVYPVADLVVPIPQIDIPQLDIPPAVDWGKPITGSPISIPGPPHLPLGGDAKAAIYPSPQAGDLALRAQHPAKSPSMKSTPAPKCDASPLIELITQTVKEAHGQKLPAETNMAFVQETLSLVVRASQPDHEIIADLIADLRRKQDVQVTLECQVLKLSDDFWEQIGLDLDFDHVNSGQVMSVPLRPRETEFILKTVRKSKGVKLLASPKLTVFNGIGAQLQFLGTTDGDNSAHKIHCMIVPTISEDRCTIDLKFAVNPTSTLDALSKAKSISIPDGQSVLIEVTDELLSSPKRAGIPEVDKALRALKKKELGVRTFVLLTPKIIIQEEEEEQLLEVVPKEEGEVPMETPRDH